MAEIATIARPYADALFSASSADSQGTAAWLDEVAAVAADPQLQRFVDDPKIAPDQVFGLIAGVVRTPLPQAAQNFLRVLIENGRLNALPEIAAQYRALRNGHAGTSDAVVYSAFPIDGDALQQVTAALERRFGRKLDVTVETDPELIGGIRAVVGDEVLDTSVKARLAQMKAALAA